MKVSVRKLWPAIVAIAVVGAVVYAFLPAPVTVDIAPVTRGQLQVTVNHEGKTRIKEKYVVSSPLPGRVLRVDMHPGDPVVAGKTMLTAIQPTDPTLLDVRARAEAEARVKAAEAGQKRALAVLDREKQAHQLARHEFDRAAQLLPTRAISKQDYENLEHREHIAQEALRAAQFGAAVAEFELEQARAALLRTQPRDDADADAWRFDIRSPISGKVLRVFQESAAVVTPGTRLLELGDDLDLECEIDVLSTDAVKIRPGAKVWLEHWGGDHPLLGRVRVIEPAAFTKVSSLGVEEQRVWVIVDFDDPLARRPTLGDGYRVEARIVVWEGENVLKAPAGALFRSADGWAVYVAENGKARLRPVNASKSNGLETEVLDGLREWERVVIHPIDRVRDGVSIASRVEPRN